MSSFSIIKNELERQNNLPPNHYINDLLAYCRIICNSKYPLNSIILFGSLVKGTYKPLYSDVDLILVFNDLPATYSERFYYKREAIFEKSPSGIQATWFTREEFEENYEARTGFVLDALYQGWILLDNEKFVNGFKEKLFQRIKDGLIIRKGNHWAWPMPNNKLDVITL